MLANVNHLLIFFAERMLTHISKVELVEMAKKTRAAAKMPKDSLTRKKKAPVTITQAPTEQDEETTWELVFKRKRKAIAPPTEHSIQECEAESSKRKIVWDLSFTKK